MRCIFKLLFALFLAFTLNADEYALISNKDITHLSTNQIKAIYLKKLTMINGQVIIPINLDARDQLRQKFSQNLLHMSFERLKSYWTQEHYLGHRPPLSLKSQESVKKFIKNVDGSIGYINMKNIDKNITILYRWED